jgi:hypothetical protein
MFLDFSLFPSPISLQSVTRSYGLNKYPPKVLVLQAWSTGWRYQEVMEPLRSGALWEVLRSLMDAVEGKCGTVISSFPLFSLHSHKMSCFLQHALCHCHLSPPPEAQVRESVQWTRTARTVS